MSELAKSRNEKILDALDKLELWARRAVLFLVVLAVLMAILAPTAVAYAQGGDPPTDDAANNLVAIFTELGKLAIRVIYALIMIVFAVGTVKAGLGAQAAQAFGASGRVSLEMMNLVGGIAIFGVAIMTLPLVNMVIDSVTGKLLGGGFTVDIHNPFVP